MLDAQDSKRLEGDDIESFPVYAVEQVVSGAAMLGVICVGVVIGMYATIIVVALPLQGTGMETYVTEVFFSSPTWFKSLVLGAHVLAPFGLVRLFFCPFYNVMLGVVALARKIVRGRK